MMDWPSPRRRRKTAPHRRLPKLCPFPAFIKFMCSTDLSSGSQTCALQVSCWLTPSTIRRPFRRSVIEMPSNASHDIKRSSQAHGTQGLHPLTPQARS
jgi:hypothetical protein